MTSVQRQDVKDVTPGSVGKLEGVEQDVGGDSNLANKKQENVGDERNIKSTLNVEEDVPPSLFQKLKGKLLGSEDMQAKNSEPAAAASGIFSQVQQSIWGKKDEVSPKEEGSPKEEVSPKEEASPKDELSAKDEVNSEGESVSSKVALPQSVVPTEPDGKTSIPFRPDLKAGAGSDELGTGYEEDTERGALSSESSADLSEKEGFLPQSESLFKPTAAKDASEMTLDDLRGSKMTQATSLDDVKAPGPLGRAYEEVEAVADELLEGLNLKGKQGASGDEKGSATQGGFFTRIAEKIGYGGHGRSQSE